MVIAIIIVILFGFRMLSPKDGDGEALNEETQLLENELNEGSEVTRLEPLDMREIPGRGYLMGTLIMPFEGQSFEDAFHSASENFEIVPIWGTYAFL